MMRRNLYMLAIASLLSGNYVFAQDTVKQWSLEECIQYAIEHNIDLKQKEQEQESRKVDLHTSKYSWLPALNGSLGQSFQFGRSTSKSGVIVDHIGDQSGHAFIRRVKNTERYRRPQT